jgi:hypothetical protein
MDSMSEPQRYVRFTGGPLYWRRGRGKHYRVKMLDSTQVLQVLGTVRPMKRQFRNVDELTEYLKNHGNEFRTGTYRRVEPDRFRWEGWDA